MLTLAKNIFVPTNPYTPKVKEVNKSTQWSFWLKILKFIIEFVGAAIISIVTGGLGISTFAALAIDFFAQSTLNLVSDLIFYNGKIDWKSFGISAGLSLIPFVNKGIREASKVVKLSKIKKLTANIADSSTKLKVIKALKNTDKFGYEYAQKQGKNFIHNFESLDLGPIKYLDKGIFKTTDINVLNNQYLIFAKKIDTFKKVFVRARNTVSLLTSPRYAAKKVTNLAFSKFKKILNNTTKKALGSKNYTKYVTNPKKQIKKILSGDISALSEKLVGKKLSKEKLKQIRALRKAEKSIPINSAWLDRIKIMQTSTLWHTNSYNFILYFNPRTTNGKEPVFLINKKLKDIFKMIKSDSPGREYLNNFAYGWEIGKFIRKFNGFGAISKLPLYGNFLSTAFYTAQTGIFIAKSIENNKWLWRLENAKLANEFIEGIKENIPQNIRIKELNPVISFAKSLATNDTRFLVREGTKIGAKAYYKSQIKKNLIGYRIPRNNKRVK
ncbi:hypothetical protein [Mycoplasmopsis meleagridis]|uniref:hypothetical protein n=1 Tax=Mycoplasmopsis meleagridis TaxID=29561 RepID=UPI00073D2DE4|nr:hypothetical protein [Mycoplasmopsis meleagridis]KUH47511.1 hypothetical protein ASB56_00020 [Mycoplasmopsis meleagridis]